jgi:hypothetical protein
MARKEYSTIVTARLDVNSGWLREVQQRRSGRCPSALRNSLGSPVGGREASHAFKAAAVSFHSGSTRSRRPFPSTWMLDSFG